MSPIFTKEDVLLTLHKIEVESKVVLRYEPKIVNVVYDESQNVLYIIVLDRPDKSSLVGYGGLKVKKLKERLRVKDITVIALSDLNTKRLRIKGALEKLKQIANKLENRYVSRILFTYIEPLLIAELKYPPRTMPEIKSESETDVVAAYSGGVDSTATLYILKKLGLNVIALTVNPGPYIIPDEVKEDIEHAVEKLNIEHHFISPRESFNKIVEAALEGRVMPCSMCYPIIAKTVYNWARRRNVQLVFFGDLLSTSYSSIMFIMEYGIVRINLPGVLALTKFDTKFIAKEILRRKPDYVYGCPLLREAIKRHRWMKFIAFERILRETRAGVLEPMEALRYIKRIDKAYYSYFAKYLRKL